jgi:hypothetical protein
MNARCEEKFRILARRTSRWEYLKQWIDQLKIMENTTLVRTWMIQASPMMRMVGINAARIQRRRVALRMENL